MNANSLVISVFVVAALLPSQIAAGVADYIRQFGVSEGKPISTGFVILEGRYINPPYTISRRGLDLFVNNRKIGKPLRHPGEKPLFGGISTDNLSDEQRLRLHRVLETAKKVYEMNLEKGECYVFAQGRHAKHNLYNVVYRAPSRLSAARTGNPILDHRLNQLWNSLMRIDEFGVKAGGPVSNGFVFVDAQYIDAPYVVSRRGLALFINDTMVQPPFRLPYSDAGAADMKRTDPNLPLTITSDSSSFDPDVREYIGNKAAYLLNTYSTKEEATKRMVAVYRELLCVKDAQLDTTDKLLIIVSWTDGTVDRIRQFPPVGRRRVAMDRQSVLERLETQRSHYEERLAKGDYYFLSIKGKGPRVTGGKAGAKEVLPKIIPVLRSLKSYEEKLSELARLEECGLYDLGKEIVKHVESNQFQASDQFYARLSALIAE